MQDESILTITYFNEDGTEIPGKLLSYFATASQTTIRVERDPSYPDITNPDGRYDETTLNLL